MQRRFLFTGAAATVLATACGGGGGGDDTTPPPPATATVSLSGVAAKGLLAGADVAVYAVNADGSVSTTALDTKTTDAQGNYSLSFTGTAGQAYVVKVTAKAGTTHADEATGNAAAPLPVGFSMRSVVVPASNGPVTVSAGITPFTELAVAAAAKGTGGLTAANVAQGVSTVNQLLGFNPVQVAAKPLSTAASNDEKKLAVLLTAVSALAKDGALGCNTGTAGDKTKCVVDTLASAGSLSTIKLSAGSTDVSTALGGAITTVLADPALTGTVNPTLLSAVAANLACSGAACNASSTGAPGTTATAIAAAKLLFTQIKTDWSSLFTRGGAIATGGAANAQAYAFKTAFDGVQLPIETLGKDLGTLLMGIDLYDDYKAGRTTQNGRGRAEGQLVATDGNTNYTPLPTSGCTLYQDAATSIPATTPANANFIGCGARYYLSHVPGTNVVSEWRHSFTVTPNTDGSFGYTTRARRRDLQCSGTPCVATTNSTVLANPALQVDGTGAPIPAFAGTVRPTLSAAFGDITAFTLTGDFAAAFQTGTTNLVGFKQVASLSGTQTANADGTVSSSLSGTLVLQDSAGATISSVNVKTGTMGQIPVSFDAQGNVVPSQSPAAQAPAGHQPATLSLDLVFGTPTGEFEGLFSATTPVLDKSATEYVPTVWSLSGALRTISGGVKTEFLSGRLDVTVLGEANFNATLPPSATNKRSYDTTFVGVVTAPSRPALSFTFGETFIDDGSNAGWPATLQYRTLVGGQPRLVVSVAWDGNGHFTLSEASSNLSMTWTKGALTAPLLVGSTQIGVLDTGTGLVTFTDGSFVSLDIGL